ncbi:response regulator transcription factor [Verrucomicrobiaceae bacterium R5-34]|uniref:Response regulator transcription factor n=1 Tax=Oceaniferula flava TaxID=2800421 RepID=A0AAE2SAV3_9BACT|nr:response regulator transcription factor [Oceaniferula flavus]MBK1829350.1 response regulator transcription factor [Verrucomicrobiaceae bacterium R5-34]MBK1853577.1 response regulator transcription factor [Oceaniferula flavus]MBM1134882.1 response regulator transcription factor [Oceaniferula flavus]
MQTILVIEDEADIADLIAFNLRRNNFNVEMSPDGLHGLAAARSLLPDLIVLDLMMPGMDGVSLFKELQREATTRKIPVIMLTARGQTEDKIAGLEIGADDYMTKPFSPKELMLRIKNLLKRSVPASSGAELKCGPFRFIKNSLKFYVDGEEVDLTATEFKLMLYLSERRNVPQDRHDLLMEVMGYSSDVHSRTLDTHMKRLRRKLGDRVDLLETVRGVGYKLNVPDEEGSSLT